MRNNFKLQSIQITIILLISCLPALGQIDRNFWKNTGKAFAAISAAECQSSLKFCIDVLKTVPNHPVMNYLAARLNEQLGNSDIALKYLKMAAGLGYTSRKPSETLIHTLNDPVFSALREKKEFKEIIKTMKISDKPIYKSQVAFIIIDKRLDYYEGITHDPVEKMFYLGSDHKIVKVDHSGKIIDYTREGEQDRLGWVNGVHVDPVRRILWACSNDKNWDNAIFKYDLSSLRLIKKYIALPNGTRNGYNDLVIHPNGDVYLGTFISELDCLAISIIPHTSDKMELFFRNKSFTGANGITLSDDGRVIYAATNVGICKIVIKTKSFSLLTHGEDFNTYGIDGLYCKNNSLYAMQYSNRHIYIRQVNRFLLNKNATHIKSCEILEKNTPNLNGPTTGVIVDDYYYFLAGKNQEGIVVMKTPIKK